MSGEIHNMREKRLVSMRAVAAGMTSNAEMSRVPMTRMVTKMVSDNITISAASINETFTPLTSATSGSNVEKRNLR